MWRCNTAGRVELLHGARLAGTPCALAWAARGGLLAVGETSGGLQIYQRAPLLPLNMGRAALPAGTYASCMAFDGLDTRLATGSSDGIVTIWRLPEMGPIIRFSAHEPAAILSLDWSSAGPASAGANLLTSAAPLYGPMVARVWKASDGTLLREAVDEPDSVRNDGKRDPLAHSSRRPASPCRGCFARLEVAHIHMPRRLAHPQYHLRRLRLEHHEQCKPHCCLETPRQGADWIR